MPTVRQNYGLADRQFVLKIKRATIGRDIQATAVTTDLVEISTAM